MYNVMGVDQSIEGTAFSIFSIDEDKKVQLVSYGWIPLNPKEDLSKRINTIKHELADVAVKYDVSLILLEELHLNKNVKVFEKLAFLLGVLFDTFYELEISTGAIPSSTWRSKLGINKGVRGTDARAKYKLKAIAYVQEHFNITGDIDDIAEAICIGYVGAKAYAK